MKSCLPFLILSFLTVVTVLSFPNVNFAQAPDLGTAANFVLFSPVGAVGNTGISQLTGNVGTNSGAITGFGNVNGVMHNADAATAQAATDLQAAWKCLDTMTLTSTHGPVLGNGETLFAGVDTIAAAGSIVGILNLDAKGDPNAIFIFKIGGALTTAASATVNLINGALACNVFWITNGGAISLAASTTMRGTLIANPGAIDMGDGCTFEGRALSTTGAVSVYGTLAYIPIGCGSPILAGPSAPDSGPLECYVLFSSDGSILNSGVTNVTGDVGTNNGTTTGYNPALVTGTVHTNPDFSTTQCAVALTGLYTYLDTLRYDIELLYPSQFGNKLVLTPHTYRMNAATLLTDTVYLNAQGNADAVFFIQVNGAFTTSTYSKVKLINGTQAKNVYWKVTGAVTIENNSVFCGTIVSNGPITFNTGDVLNGRALTTVGIINTTAITVNKPSSCSFIILPIELLSFTGACDKQNIVLKWSTAGEINNGYYSIERGSNGINWQVVGMIENAGNSPAGKNYSFTDKEPYDVSYYRLKQTDLDGKSTNLRSIVVKNCKEDLIELNIYPNPANRTVNVLFTGDKAQVHSMSIYNVAGEKVYTSGGFQPAIDIPGIPDGIYFLHFNLLSKSIIKKIVIKK